MRFWPSALLTDSWMVECSAGGFLLCSVATRIFKLTLSTECLYQCLSWFIVFGCQLSFSP